MIRGLATLALAFAIILVAPSTADAGCEEDGDLTQTSAKCYYSGDEVRAAIKSSSGYRWVLQQRCKAEGQDGSCFNPVACVTASGAPGTLYTVFRIPLPDGPRETYGYACLTAREAGELGAITPAMVFAAMQRLTWPRSDLLIQPPGGETLVNLETNFLTTNTQPTTQVVTLLGQRVEIEATPDRYVWHWAGRGETDEPGDTGSIETEDPGARYPHLEVTHVYRDADITVHPWVDTVYAGRYRVNGGAWTVIPQTLTVTGDAVELRVLEARPVLVG